MAQEDYYRGFGSIQGRIGNSGVRIGPPQEDAPLNPRPMRERFQFKGLPQPYSPGGVFPPGAIPTPDFSPGAVAPRRGIDMPPAPEERIPLPVYEEPERPGKWRTALGIGLSGAAGLAGQSQTAAQQFFLAPEARAERDYARDLAAYSARQGEWDKYYEQVLAAQGIDIRERTLEEQKRQFDEEGRRPIAVPYRGSLYDPTEEEVMFTDPRAGTMDTQWGAQREQAFAYWLQANPGKTREGMTAFEKDEAIEGWRRRRGLEVGVAGFGPGGTVINVPRGESYYQERPAIGYDEEGNVIYQQGRTGARPPVDPINAEDMARIDEWEADEKRKARADHQTAGLQLLAPLPGTPEREAFDKALDDELLAIEAEANIRRERLRSGTIDPLPGEDRVLQYNIRTGRAE